MATEEQRPVGRVGVGLHGNTESAVDILDRARLAEELELASLWLVQLPNLRDNMSLLGALAVSTQQIRLGAGIMPVYTRPPVVMAHSAATIDELSGGRFTLGLGMGHRLTGEWSLGVPQGPPLPAMREYLSIVRGLLRDGEAHVDGEWYRSHATYGAPLRPDIMTCVGALGPGMCRLAGEAADGLLLWMCPVDYVRDVAIPHLREGLRRSGRDPSDFPVSVFMPASVSDDPQEESEIMRKYVSTYARMPNYRRMFEVSGFGDQLQGRLIGDRLLGEVGVVGDDTAVRQRVEQFFAAGATEVVVTPMAHSYHDPARWRRTMMAARG